MGERVWIVGGDKPHPFPKTERDHLCNELWELKYIVPDAETIELEYLRDIVDMAREQAAKQAEIDRAEAEAGLAILMSMNREQQLEALRAFTKWRANKERAEGRRPKNDWYDN